MRQRHSLSLNACKLASIIFHFEITVSLYFVVAVAAEMESTLVEHTRKMHSSAVDKATCLIDNNNNEVEHSCYVYLYCCFAANI